MSNRTLATFTLVGALLLLPSSAVGQVPTQDSVTAAVPVTTGPIFNDIQIDARSGPSGENPTGTALFNFRVVRLGGPVTCLTVEGRRATLNVRDEVQFLFGLITIEVVDNAGTGAPDTFDAAPSSRLPNDCSPLSPTLHTFVASGDIAVVDAPPLPTSKEQCKNNGWRKFPGFKNQGQCTAFVQRGP